MTLARTLRLVVPVVLAVLAFTSRSRAQVESAAGSSAAVSTDARRTPDVHVDPRIELLSIAARLAGFDEYNMPNSASPYADRVQARFGPHADHPAIATLRELHSTKGVSFDAIPSMALHLDGVPSLTPRLPFTPRPERLDARWQSPLTDKFLEQLRDFATVTDAAGFFKDEQPFYSAVSKRLAAVLARSKALEWFDAFFGARAQATYTAIPGLLCGGGNYGMGVRFTDGRPEEISPIFGCWKFDSSGVPVFGDSYLSLYIHELCHTYSNPFIDASAPALEAPGQTIYAGCAERMRRQGYGAWRTVLYESLVRACVIRCRLATEGAAAANQQANEELANGFAWVPDLAKLLGEYDDNRTTYPQFSDFMPSIVAFFDKTAAALPTPAFVAPALVSISPASGDTNVDPAITEMTITFDRPMRDQSWSIVGAKADQPAVRGKPAYDPTRHVLTIPITLEPGKVYRFRLNSDKLKGFQSAEGVPLESVEVTFTTRK